MNKVKIIVSLAVILFTGVIYLITWYSSTVPLKITIDPNSSILTDLVVTTSKDNHQKTHQLPYSARVKPGEYTVTAWGNGSSIVATTITALKGEKNSFSLLFEQSTGEKFLELYGVGEDEKTVPNADLFPRETADYLITIEDDGEKITKIIIFAKHRFTKPPDGASYIEERDIVVAGAKNWLIDQGIPKNIKIEIKDL